MHCLLLSCKIKDFSLCLVLFLPCILRLQLPLSHNYFIFGSLRSFLNRLLFSHNSLIIRQKQHSLNLIIRKVLAYHGRDTLVSWA